MAFNPINKSKASSFLFKLHNSLADVEFYITATSLPGVSLEMNTVNAPSLSYPKPGDLLTFGDLPLTILSDEGLEIWTTLFNFITVTTSRPDMIYTDIETPSFEGVMYLLTNKGNAFKKIVYHDCYVKEVSSYDLGISDDKIETFTVSIAFSYCHIEDIPE